MQHCNVLLNRKSRIICVSVLQRGRKVAVESTRLKGEGKKGVEVSSPGLLCDERFENLAG